MPSKIRPRGASTVAKIRESDVGVLIAFQFNPVKIANPPSTSSINIVRKYIDPPRR
jgi:hypothetical protein